MSQTRRRMRRVRHDEVGLQIAPMIDVTTISGLSTSSTFVHEPAFKVSLFAASEEEQCSIEGFAAARRALVAGFATIPAIT
jgi:hypothetical protein